jgi:DUF1365 family protein
MSRRSWPLPATTASAFTRAPGEDGNATWRLARIDHGDAAGDLLHTAISGNAEPLASGPLLKAFVRFPLLTLGVILRIHWQALKLWRKRVPFFRKPAPPLEETTR